MARDAEQTFYYHNRLLLRFLLSATIVFVVVLVLVWWREQGTAKDESTPSLTIRTFSDVSVMADATKEYAYGARYIHDAETFPAIKARFFSGEPLGFSSAKDLEAALSEVRAAHARLDEGVKNHVYSTSYYVGNLRVLPDKTLHELILEGRSNTSVLLDAALADVRAGVIKIGQYYDTAPPSAYDASLAGAIYYPAPSMPSLTVSEAAIVLYLLADLDSTYARTYEQQLVDYANHVLASGAHFASDIQAAIDLAQIYYEIMKDDPSYQILLDRARVEWNGARMESVARKESIAPARFLVGSFPYGEEFFINQIINNGYDPVVQENLSGQLRLTLRDTRIPNAVSRIYGINLGGDDVLPLDLEVQKRRYPFMLDSLELASYNSATEYIAISQSEAELTLIKREANSVNEIRGLELDSKGTDLDVRYDLGRLLVGDYDSEQDTNRVQFAVLDASTARMILSVEDVSDASIFDEKSFIVLEEGVVKIVDSTNGVVRAVEGVRALPTGANRRLRYFHDLATLAVVDNLVDQVTLVPEARVALYAVSRMTEGGVTGLSADLVYGVTIIDTLVEDFAMSPGGRYLAVASTESLGTQRPKLLIFDTLNGIIKKEIDLTDFEPGLARLDAWLSL